MLALIVCAVAAGAATRVGLAQDQTVQPGTAAIWTDQSTYDVGATVNVCYRIPIAGQITITNIPPGDQPIFYSGESSGTSGCMPGIITPPAGTQCLRLSYPLFGGQGQTQTCFTVSGGGPGPMPLSIYTDRQFYNVGDPIDVCYKVPGPGQVRIIDQIEEDTPTTFFSGYDDGTGGCIPGTITPPTGRECMTIVFTDANGQESPAETCFQTSQ
jgi:hypothetical protein